MCESEAGAVPHDGAEAKSGRRAAGDDADGFALVGFLFVRVTMGSLFRVLPADTTSFFGAQQVDIKPLFRPGT